MPHRHLHTLEIPGKLTKQLLDKVKENVLKYGEGSSTKKIARETFCGVRTGGPILPGYGEELQDTVYGNHPAGVVS